MLTLSAAEIIGRDLKKGAIVVLESTIYPDVTEEIIAPILDLENESGLKCGADFKIGYSPERINPGDDAHTLDRIQNQFWKQRQRNGISILIRLVWLAVIVFPLILDSK